MVTHPIVIVTAHVRDEEVKSEIDNLFAGKTISGPQTYLEKPVKPQDYVNMVKRELGIEFKENDEIAPAPLETLQTEIRNLLSAADPETLKAALNLLREKKNPKPETRTRKFSNLGKEYAMTEALKKRVLVIDDIDDVLSISKPGSWIRDLRSTLPEMVMKPSTK